jgi:AcrR family transcriptional regulator
MLRTKAAIEEALIELVLERGYEKVSVEDITERADVARATFYAHYANKEALLSAIFSRLIEGLLAQIDEMKGGWTEVRRDLVQTVYKHAEEMRDLYRACLSDSRAREVYISTLTRQIEQNFRARLKSLGRKPRIPVYVMARGFAGAHAAILESWLAGNIDCNARELASMELDFLVAGAARGLGTSLTELAYLGEPGSRTVERRGRHR